MITIFGEVFSDSGLRISRGPMVDQQLDNTYQFFVVLNGDVVLNHDNEVFRLKKNDCLLTLPNQMVNIQLASEQDTVLILILSEDLLSQNFLRNRKRFIEIQDTLVENSELKQSIDQLLHHYLLHETVDFRLISLAYECLYQLYFLYGDYETLPSSNDDRITQITRYIASHYQHELTLTELAQRFQMTSNYFSRFFKKHFQVGFVEYLTEYRLKIAAEKIRKTDEKIAVIAGESGFLNLSNFNKKFRQSYGVSPSQYRAVNREKQIERPQPVDETIQILASLEEVVQLPASIHQVNLYEETISQRNQAPWSKLINIGSAEDLQQYDIRKHLTILKRDLDFEYARFWNLFTAGMNIDPTVTADYNFDKIDSILDFFVEIDILPFIELSYKIRRVHRSVKEAVVYERDDFNVTINSAEWKLLLEKFMSHVTGRYGKKYVDKWYFEMTFTHTSPAELAEQIQHYQLTYSIIKKYASKAQVGGPGAKPLQTSSYDFKQDLLTLAAREVPFDFISYMIYPYQEDEKGERYAQIIADPDYLKKKITELKRALADTDYAECPLYITEWSNTISNRSAINDTVYKGTYIIKNMIAVINDVTGIGYWVGSDLFGEFADSRAILHGGTGLIAKQEISKPALLAMSFLSFMRPIIVQQTANHLVTKSTDDNFSIICHNYKTLHADFYHYMSESELKIDELIDGFIDKEALRYRFNLRALVNSHYELKILRVNSTAGNIINGWRDLGDRVNLRKQDIDYLLRIAQPQVSYQQLYAVKDELQWEVELEANEFIYMSVTKLN